MHNPDFVARGPVTVNSRRIISSALASPMILGKRACLPPGKMPYGFRQTDCRNGIPCNAQVAC
jgi:hypothetical protein